MDIWIISYYPKKTILIMIWLFLLGTSMFNNNKKTTKYFNYFLITIIIKTDK